MEEIRPFLEPGLIYGIGAIGLAIIFRYLRFPDFTVLGSIMVGGIVALNLTPQYGPVMGIMGGALSSALLGCTTALLVTKLAIPAILSGIIVFTGSFSIGYLLTEGGTIELEESVDAFFEPSSASLDLTVLILLVLVLTLLVSFVMNTRWGALLLAMTADERFIRFRHRYRNNVFIFTVSFGNFLVGMAGAIYALNDRAAHVHSHVDFLPFALGAIFAGNAVTLWGSHLFKKYRVTVESLKDERGISAESYVMKKVESFLVIGRNDATNIFFLMMSYVLGAVIFTIISRSVQTHVFGAVHPDYQYLIVAFMMIIFVFWSGSTDRKE